MGGWTWKPRHEWMAGGLYRANSGIRRGGGGFVPKNAGPKGGWINHFFSLAPLGWARRSLPLNTSLARMERGPGDVAPSREGWDTLRPLSREEKVFDDYLRLCSYMPLPEWS
jgi:hypothetical protein